MKPEELEFLLIEWLESDGYTTEEAEEMAESTLIEYNPMEETIKVTYSNWLEETFKITTRKVLTK